MKPRSSVIYDTWRLARKAKSHFERGSSVYDKHKLNSIYFPPNDSVDPFAALTGGSKWSKIWHIYRQQWTYELGHASSAAYNAATIATSRNYTPLFGGSTFETGKSDEVFQCFHFSWILVELLKTFQWYCQKIIKWWYGDAEWLGIHRFKSTRSICLHE